MGPSRDCSFAGRTRQAKPVGWLAVCVAPALASCALFLDTGGLSGGTPDVNPPPAEAGSEDASLAQDGPSTETCVDGGPQPPECLAQWIPAQDLLVWLRADEGVETSEDGRVTAWRDSTPKLRPGSLGNDAKQTNVEARPHRITEAAGPVIVFDGNQSLELPPGFDDFTRGLTLFAAAWPELDGSGGTGAFFSLGFPPFQDDCGRAAELSYTNFGVDYRVENIVFVTSAIIDGRGWDVLAVTQTGSGGSPQCPGDEPVSIRRGVDLRETSKTRPLMKQVRTGTKLGDSGYFPGAFYSGKLGELLLYNRALGDDEIARVTGYLARRWPRL